MTEEIAYIYMRDGIEFFTPVEKLAALRNDQGTYKVVYAEVISENEIKLEETK